MALSPDLSYIVETDMVEKIGILTLTLKNVWIFNYPFISLVSPGRSCNLQDPRSSLWHLRSFSCRMWDLQLQSVNSQLWHPIPQPRTEPRLPALPRHWTARTVPWHMNS